jgi:hypothetical protein
MMPVTEINTHRLSNTTPPKADATNSCASTYGVQLVSKISLHLQNITINEFDGQDTINQLIAHPLDQALAVFSHLSGEELLFAIASFLTLSHLDPQSEQRTTSCNLIFGLCEVAARFFSVAYTPLYTSTHGQIMWYEDFIQKLTDKLPTGEIINSLITNSHEIIWRGQQGLFTSPTLPSGKLQPGDPYTLVSSKNRFHQWYAFSKLLQHTMNSVENQTILSGILAWQEADGIKGPKLAEMLYALSITYMQNNWSEHCTAWPSICEPDVQIENWKTTPFFISFAAQLLIACPNPIQRTCIFEALNNEKCLQPLMKIMAALETDSSDDSELECITSYWTI